MSRIEDKLAERAARNLETDPGCKARARRAELRAMCTSEEGTLTAYTMSLPAAEFSAQLDRMAEANAVLQRAWEAEMFEDIFTDTLRKDTCPHVVSAAEENKLTARITARAYEILAEQYADLKVMCREPSNRFTGRRACWVRVLASGVAK